jgi:hypothetical protein
MEITLEMIAELPASRQLDALVAEHILGTPPQYIIVGPASEMRDWGPLGMQLTAPIEHYSTRMGPAWDVVERMQELEEDGKTTNAVWWNFWHSGQAHLCDMSASEAALAVCRAALSSIVIPRESWTDTFAKLGKAYENVDFLLVDEPPPPSL